MPATAQVKKPKKLPKSNGALADELYKVKAERLAAQKIVDELKARESELTSEAISRLSAGEMSGVSGKVARVSVVLCEVPQVNDWDKFYEFVMKKKAMHLLQKRLSVVAVEEYMAAGKVPGVDMFKYKKVSLNKL